MKVENKIDLVDSKATGERIRFYRRNNNLSTSELALKLGMKNRIAVNKWESGENVPTVDHLVHMSRIFKCKIDDLVVAR